MGRPGEHRSFPARVVHTFQPGGTRCVHDHRLELSIGGVQVEERNGVEAQADTAQRGEEVGVAGGPLPRRGLDHIARALAQGLHVVTVALQVVRWVE